jgi:hypothetical protein
MTEQSPYVEYNERRYARVSSLIAPMTNWSRIPAHILSNKSDIGTQAHQAIDDHLNNIPPTCRPESLPYLDSYIIWKEALKPEYLVREQRFYDDVLQITGQVDGVIKLPDSPLPLLIDYKTSVKANPDAWKMQASFYHYLLAVNGIECQKRALFLRLSPRALEPRVHVYDLSDSTTSLISSFAERFWHSCKQV